MTTFNKTFYIDGISFDVEFESSPYVSVKISGPPENCHPAEGGEVEIIAVNISSQDIMPFLSESTMSRLQEMCEEAVPEMFSSLRDQALEDEAESRAWDREMD